MYMAPRRNKFKKFDYIKLDKLYVGRSNVRTENVVDEEELDSLAEHINQHGLLEPIVVFEVNSLDKKNELYDSRLPEFKDKFEISCQFVKWKPKEEVHGRRIHSNYGGFQTEIMPFEICNSYTVMGKVKFDPKNNGFKWIEPKEYAHSIAYK